mmetsp:Transcript_11962/g.39656  ORF Transcript_11962/g.39656 Transcript_11962/m.39656 type:complete len:204 (+) Transcript_11962:33-644(+)
MHRPQSCSRTDPFITVYARSLGISLCLSSPPRQPAPPSAPLAAPHSTNGPRRPTPPPLRAAIRRCVPACNPRPPPGAPRSLAGCSGAGEGGARRLHGRRDGRGEGDAADALVVAGRADDGHRVVDAGAGAEIADGGHAHAHPGAVSAEGERLDGRDGRLHLCLGRHRRGGEGGVGDGEGPLASDGGVGDVGEATAPRDDIRHL